MESCNVAHSKLHGTAPTLVTGARTPWYGALRDGSSSLRTLFPKKERRRPNLSRAPPDSPQKEGVFGSLGLRVPEVLLGEKFAYVELCEA